MHNGTRPLESMSTFGKLKQEDWVWDQPGLHSRHCLKSNLVCMQTLKCFACFHRVVSVSLRLFTYFEYFVPGKRWGPKHSTCDFPGFQASFIKEASFKGSWSCESQSVDFSRPSLFLLALCLFLYSYQSLQLWLLISAKKTGQQQCIPCPTSSCSYLVSVTVKYWFHWETLKLLFPFVFYETICYLTFYFFIHLALGFVFWGWLLFHSY